MGLLDRFKGESQEHDDIRARLSQQEDLTEELARRVSFLEAHVAILKTYRIKGQRGPDVRPSS